MNNQELQKILSSFTINDDNEKIFLEFIEEMKKREILKQHNYEIFTAQKNGGIVYRTYIPDEHNAYKRKLIERKKKEDLEKILIEFYTNATLKTNKKLFKNVLSDWLIFYKKSVKESTFSRTYTDVKRFFINTVAPFNNIEISKIKRIDLKNFIQDTIISNNLKIQGCKNLKSILNGVFKYAVDSEYISINPMNNLDISLSNIATKTTKTKTQSVWTTKEKELIINSIWKNKNNWKETTDLLILLLFQTALRVGEVVALKWEDVDFTEKTLKIQRQEIVSNKWEDNLEVCEKSIHTFVNYTKTEEGNRIIPLTDESINILNEIKIFNSTHNINDEFIFKTKDGIYFNRQRVNTRLYSYCDRLGIERKSSHKIRRSVLSTLLDNVDNKKVIQNFAGHKDIQTTLKSYYRDITDEKDFYKTLNAVL